jgi:glycosyltransferase involved in cell wall biosynthesis
MLSGRLSIVIPAFNEAHRLGATLEAIRQYALGSGRPCEVIVVDDGSRDGTADLVRGFQADPLQLRLLVNPVNRGKGYSVRQGMLAVPGRGFGRPGYMRLSFALERRTIERGLPGLKAAIKEVRRG